MWTRITAAIVTALQFLALPAMAEGQAQALADRLLEQSGSPGIGVAIWQNGQADIAVAGLRAAGGAVPVEPDDLWHIGSNTKSMTALLVARLAADGRISLDETIGGVLGDALPDIHAGFYDITYREMLNHRSGLVANIGMLAMMRLGGMRAERDMIADRLAYSASALRRPGGARGEFLYSNAGYIVTGAMLEARLGQSWEDLLTAELFTPLEMNSAGFGAPGLPGVVDQPRGHRPGIFGGYRAVEPGPAGDNVPALGPAGTVHLSLGDMLTYLRAHLAQDPAFLPAQSWAFLHQPEPGEDYVSGWGLYDGALAHTGSNTLWYMLIAFDRQSQTALVLAANSGNGAKIDPLFSEAARAVLAD